MPIRRASRSSARLSRSSWRRALSWSLRARSRCTSARFSPAWWYVDTHFTAGPMYRYSTNTKTAIKAQRPRRSQRMRVAAMPDAFVRHGRLPSFATDRSERLEALPPAGVARAPAQLALGLRVRRPADLGHHRVAGRAE